MECFVDRDADYVRWTRDNPGGFVINTYRRPSARYLKLHRAGCRTITVLQPAATRWTTGDYVKICGTRADLEAWAARMLRASPEPCSLCC
ncbi:hypothetical protein [Catenuloplanes indicus]|uniref:Uncharacterized protein n=1 Tax=Catenuloplanes indicus TaxID=137267 RepID=A0AAE3VVP9_9ACTN|nr:hypothetical protein [Catenuloplanes indicus]MDQ0364087.1 hypothetical protein [Catenuloplanes indicus]